MLTDGVPRVSLAHLPTPLEEMSRLAQVLNGPRLLIKRDDQTGLAGGGNKARKLEFTIADALRQGADTLITVGGVQSNHCRQTAAAAVRYRLACRIVLSGHAPPAVTGNLLLDHLLGAEVAFTGDRPLDEVVADLLLSERAAGRTPYFVPAGASDEVGAMGYVAAMEELDGQLQAQKIQVNRIVVASGSGGTQAGICAGACLLGFRGQILAISVSRSRDDLRSVVTRITAAIIQRLGQAVTCDPDKVIVEDRYLGAGYGMMGNAEVEAIRTVARTEGILLDPVYTGRAMAGLMDLIRSGVISRDETILFWHTGGAPALFAYPTLVA